MRKLLRSIAHTAMKENGLPHVNRKKVIDNRNGAEIKRSYFAMNWRKWADFVLNGGKNSGKKKPAKV